MASELQKKMAVVVLLIVIVLSAYGTWTLLDSQSQVPVIYEQGAVTGKVSIGIVAAKEPADLGVDNSG